MNLIFLIGIEGSCHHLFNDVCSFNQTNELHNLLMTYFSNSILPNIKNLLKKEINDYVNNNLNLNHMERASFPYNRPINSLSRYDIKEFYDLFKDNENVNLFFIVCVRNIIYSTLSSHSRIDSNKSIIIETKLQEDSLMYINNQVKLLPKNKYIIVDYENICNNLKLFEKELQKKSNMNVVLDNTKVKKINNSKHINNKNYNYVLNFFDNVRMKQFDFLFLNTILFK